MIVFGQKMAHGVCTQLQGMGLRVPDDVSVVAIGNRQEEIERETFLTMAGGPVGPKARRAAEILLDRIGSPSREPAQELLEMDLYFRRSTGPCRETKIEK